MSLISFLERHIADQQPKNMYVILEKHLKEVTVLHFFLSWFFIFKMQLSENKWTKNINITFGVYL